MTAFRRTVLGLLAMAAMPAWAQEDISGIWAGDLSIGPDTTLEIHFVLSLQADGTYTAILTSPDPDGVQDMPATDVSFEANRLSLSVDALSGRYQGTLADGTISGSWTQPGGPIELNLVPYVEPVLSDADKALLRDSWVGKLEIPTGALTIVFRFEDGPDGELIGFLDSPDQGANGIAVSNIEFADGTLELRVPQIGGEFSAAVAGDGMQGTWTQQGQGMPLNLTRGEYAPAGIELSAEAIARLEGSWVGRLANAAGASLAVVFRFETDEDGAFAAFLDSPDQGANGIPITEISVDADQLSLTIPAVQGSFTATLGDAEIAGTWRQGPTEQPLTLTRGEYAPTVTALDLSDAAMERLAGTWRGQMGPLELIFRFERTGDGLPVAFLDVPAQGASGLQVAMASLEEDQLTIAVSAVGANYTGTVSGNEISGEWQQGPATNELILTRDQ